MKQVTLILVAGAVIATASTVDASAGSVRFGGGGGGYYGGGGSMYAPRVYNSPPPVYSRDAYIAQGSIVGGLAGGAAGGYFGPGASGYGATVGSGLGGYYGGRMYDNQSRYMQQQYYYPPAYGIQSTTPYMERTVPRY